MKTPKASKGISVVSHKETQLRKKQFSRPQTKNSLNLKSEKSAEKHTPNFRHSPVRLSEIQPKKRRIFYRVYRTDDKIKKKMPDLGNLLNPSSNCKPGSPLKLDSMRTLSLSTDDDNSGETLRLPDVSRVPKRRRQHRPKKLNVCASEWVASKLETGVSEQKCPLPFLENGAPKLEECRACQTSVYPGEELLCSVNGCQAVYHLKCAKEKRGLSSLRKFKCPQHGCFLCKQKHQLWRCVRCELATHMKCAAFPEYVVQLDDRPGKFVCWKHPTVWRQEEKLAAPISSIEEIFSSLPLPYDFKEFDIDASWKGNLEYESKPPPYTQIRRNIYLVKKKLDDVGADIGCTSCSSSVCSEDCVCRVQCISCSKACRCSVMCTNKPFRKDKKIKVVKTELCGWGVEAAETINKGEFIIEYTGEVLSDALCEQRLWNMKSMGYKNFYMCEVRKDFTIDATFKGNPSRFLNHSCEPNCNLEKWQVEGEIRIGVFAARGIQAGEPLTYDYRFVQFGPEVKCQCGAANCQGYLGAKRKTTKVVALSGWGLTRKRTPLLNKLKNHSLNFNLAF